MFVLTEARDLFCQRLLCDGAVAEKTVFLEKGMEEIVARKAFPTAQNVKD